MTLTNCDMRPVSSAVISLDESSLFEELEPVMKILDTGDDTRDHPEGKVYTEVPDVVAEAV